MNKTPVSITDSELAELAAMEPASPLTDEGLRCLHPSIEAPLPWKRDWHSGSIVDSQESHVADLSDVAGKDADYIIAAANALPGLVAALQASRQREAEAQAELARLKRFVDSFHDAVDEDHEVYEDEDHSQCDVCLLLREWESWAIEKEQADVTP